MADYERCVRGPESFAIWQAPDQSRKVSPVITDENCGSKSLCAGMFWLAPGHQSEPDLHPHSEEVYYVVQGEGRLELGEQEFQVKAGMSVFIPAGVHHQSFNTGDEELVYFFAFAPPPQERSKADEQGWPQIK